PTGARRCRRPSPGRARPRPRAARPARSGCRSRARRPGPRLGARWPRRSRRGST
ncbi:MAG: amidase, partial [Candidatus Rokuibacteriota bacterium]